VAAGYHRVYSEFWAEARNLGWKPPEREIAIYLLTNKHRATEGLYELSKALIADDLGYSPGQVTKALRRLAEDGFAQYDDRGRVVFICKALKRQSPATGKQRIGARLALTGLPRTRLTDAFVEACECYAPALANDLAEAFEWFAHSRARPPAGVPLSQAQQQQNNSSLAPTVVERTGGGIA